MENIHLPRSMDSLRFRKSPWSLIIIFVFLSIWINVESWNVLVKTITSEITGAVTKRAVVVPLFFLVILLFCIVIYRFNNSNQRSWFLWGMIALLALTLRVTWIFLMPTNPESDFRVYHDMALLFAGNQNGGYGKPLGYPLLLSLAYRIFPDAVSGRILNVHLGMATVVLVYWAGKITTNSNGGLFAMLWMALSPTEIFMTSVLGTEVAISTFTIAAISGMLFLSYKNEKINNNYFYLPGIILGISVTIRPTSVLILFVLILLLFFKSNMQNRFLISLKIIIGVLLIPAVLVILTSFSSHQFTLRSISSDSYPLLSGTNITHNGFYNSDDVSLYYSIPEEIRSKKVFEIAMSRITEADFFVLLKFVSDKILYYLTDNLYGSVWPFYTVNLDVSQLKIFTFKKWVDVLAQSWQFLALLGTFIMIIWSLHKNDKLWVLLFSVIFFSVIPHTIFEVQSRYHHILFPYLSLACGVLTLKLITWVKIFTIASNNSPALSEKVNVR